jgi:hypothetical protein
MGHARFSVRINQIKSLLDPQANAATTGCPCATGSGRVGILAAGMTYSLLCASQGGGGGGGTAQRRPAHLCKTRIWAFFDRRETAQGQYAASLTECQENGAEQ